MYMGTRAKVITPDGISQEFNIRTGVLQGDTLAPFLFITVLEDVSNNSTSLLHPGGVRDTLTDLECANDICPQSNQVQQARELLTRVELECAKVGVMLK